MLDVLERVLRGYSMKLFLAFVALATGIQAPAQTKVHVMTTAGEQTGSISLLAQSHEDPSITIPINAVFGEVAEVPLDPGNTWKIFTDDSRWWCTHLATLSGKTPEIEVKCWETSVGKGKLIFPDGVAACADLRLEIQFPEDGREIWLSPQGRFGWNVSLGESGEFQTRFPKREIDLKIRAPGFASVFLWGQDLSGKGSIDFGVHKLTPGASIIGRVDTPDREFESVTVSIKPVSSAGGSTADSRDGEEFRAESTNPDSKGWFQLTGIPAGKWRMEASHPRFESAVTPILTVQEGVELALRSPLRLSEAIPVQIFVDPMADPNGRPWQLEVARFPDDDQGSHQALKRQKVDSRGEGAFEVSVPRGRYGFTVQDEFGFTWSSEILLVDPTVPEVFINLDLIELHGSIVRGLVPEPGSLNLRKTRGSVKVGFLTDSEGEFSGWLPHISGEWQASVINGEGEIFEISDKIMIPEKVPEGSIEVEIRIPEGIIEGTVINRNDQPVENAEIIATSIGSQGMDSVERTILVFRSVSGKDGKFRIEGVPDGRTFNVYAEKGRKESRKFPIEIPGKGPNEPVTLRLADPYSVEGIVTNPNGHPVIGANVFVFSMVNGVPAGKINTTSTDVNGRFESQVANGGDHAEILVFPGGYSLRVDLVELPQQNPARIKVSTDSGFIRLIWDDDPLSPRFPSLKYNQLPLVFPMLQGWALQQLGGQWATGEVVIPGLPLGSYSACVAGAEGQKCDAGNLSFGGTLEIDLRD